MTNSRETSTRALVPDTVKILRRWRCENHWRDEGEVSKTEKRSYLACC